MDFADALHLASSLQTQQFVTFDKRMVNKTNAININHSIRLLAIPDNLKIAHEKINYRPIRDGRFTIRP